MNNNENNENFSLLTFDDLGVSAPLMQAVEELGF